MANYTATDLAKAQAMFLARFDTEARKSTLPVTWLEYLKNPQIMFPNYMDLRTREDRVVEASTFLRTSRALLTGRSHNHTGTKGDSISVPIVWDTLSDVSSISLKQGDQNIYTNQQMLANEFENMQKNFTDGLEQAAIDFTYDSRSPINVSTAQGTFNAVEFVFDIDKATNGERASQISNTVMQENNLRGRNTFFCDSTAFDLFRSQAAQGAANATNLNFQWDNTNFVRSIGLEANFLPLLGVYTKGVWIAVPENDIAALPWIPIQNREGRDTKEQTYGTFANPQDGLNYGLHTYSERSDQSASNGYTQDELTQLELSQDVSFNYATLTTPTETPLQAFSLQ